MTVTTARLHPFDVELRVPHTSAHGSTSRRKGYLIELTDEHGNSGWGEAAPLSGHSPESLADIGPALVELASAAPGTPELELLDRTVRACAAMPSVLAAMDTALLDLAGRRAGAPIARLLNDAARSSVEVNAVISAGAPDEVDAAARRGLDNGYSSFKLKVAAGDAATDIARVGALRNALGDGPAIRLDANRGWPVSRAVQVLGAVVGLGIEYVEEPVDDPADLPALREQVGMAIAADESLADPAADQLLADGHFDVAVVKPALLGGPTRAAALADSCARQGIGVVVSSLLDTAVGLTAALHVAAAIDHQGAAGLGTGALIVDDVAQGPTVQRGRLEVPSGPGLGVAPGPSHR